MTIGGACSGTVSAAAQSANGNNVVCISSLWQYPAYQFGSTSASCNSTNAGRAQWTGAAFEFCNGTSWIAVSGAAALSSLTAAGATNSIDSANYAQTWAWGTLSTQTALTLTTSSMTTGTLLSLQDTAVSATATGKVLSISDTTTGPGYGVYSVMSGTANSGYAGYFTNTGSNNTGYAGYFKNTDTSSNNNVGVYGEADSTGGYSAGVYAYAPNGGGGNQAIYASNGTAGTADIWADAYGDGSTGVVGNSYNGNGTGVAGFAYGTGIAYGVVGKEEGTGNTGYAGSFHNESATGWSIYSYGASPNYFQSNVGIGTTTVTDPLTIYANGEIATVGVASNTNTDINFDSGRAYIGYDQANDGHLGQCCGGYNVGALALVGGDNGGNTKGIEFFVSATSFPGGTSPAMYLSPSGTLGIGTTNSSSRDLVIYGSSNVHGIAIISNGQEWDIDNRGNNDAVGNVFTISPSTFSNGIFAITTTGSVGIGTETPRTALDVTSTGIVLAGNSVYLTSVTTDSTTTTQELTGLVLPTIPGSTVVRGHCTVIWEKSAGPGTTTFAIVTSAAPTGLWVVANTLLSTATASAPTYTTITTATTTSVTGAITASGNNAAQVTYMDFVLSTAASTPVSLTIDGNTSAGADHLLTEPGSACGWEL